MSNRNVRAAIVLLGLSMMLYTTAASEAALLAHYRFDENPGATIASDETGQHDAQIQGPTLGQTGVDGFAYDFEADEDDAVRNITTFTSLVGNQMTLSAWIRPESFAAFRNSIVGASNIVFFMTLETGGFVKYQVRASDGFSSSDTVDTDTVGEEVPLDEWTHVVATRDGSTIKAYFNGRLVATSDTAVSEDFLQPTGLDIGTTANKSRDFDGLIDDVQVYDTALSDDAIQFLFNNPGTAFSEMATVSGDADGDGDVDAFDLGVWQTQFGQGGEDLSADFDNDGDVDAFDLGLWQTNFGTGVTGAIPEPATAAILALSAPVGLAVGRRQR